MSDKSDFKVLTIGLGTEIHNLMLSLLGDFPFKAVESADDFEKLIDQYSIAPGTSCFVSSALADLGHFEIAQALNSCFQGLNLIFVTTEREKFEVESLKKNGFSELIFLPLDHAILAAHVEEVCRQSQGGLKRKFKAVKLLDVQANEEMPFGVFAFLPRNNKFVSLSGPGAISEKKLEKLRTQSVNSVYVDEKEMEKFYEFTAEKLMNLGGASNESVSETEKAERLNQNVRALFRSILDSTANADFASGRDLAESASKVVDSYIKKKTGADLGARLRSMTGESQDSYGRAQAVSAIACLLSMGTGVGLPEDLAIAGLFHDIGLAGLVSDVNLGDDLMDPAEKTAFQKHPLVSLSLLKEKKVTVNAEIGEMIEKHHERIDGKGFPNGLPAHKIPLTAQLLGYADAFEYLTRSRPGKAALPAAEAHALISSKYGLSPELLNKISTAIGF
jgi:HD-GYP domain-containing protein (c-di-GMP phosphodiesterase class II)